MEVVDLSFFPDFVDGRRQILVQDSTGCPPVDVPHRHVSRCIHRSCSSTHKASLAMVLSRILHWWRFDVSYGVYLSSAGGGRRPLATVVGENPRDRFVFLDLIGFYLQI
jgi:hypothetical protein